MAHIVVGTDGSENGQAAVAWAVREGALRGLGVTAVMAWDFLDQHHGERNVLFDPAYVAADALADLDQFVIAAVGAEAAASVDRLVPDERPTPALLAAAADASLLVLGARGLGGFMGLLLGSVSSQCLHHAPCPVAIVREVPPPAVADAVARIVVGVDGSDSARPALQWAIEEATLRHASVDAVHAWHVPYVLGYPNTAPPFLTEVEAAARDTVNAAVAAEGETGVPIETITVMDAAATALIDASKGADLVVVGSRGRGGFASLVLGSVSHHVAQHASCPVVVIRQP
jgi:nucleotide-binding universal stress UspA family protein